MVEVVNLHKQGRLSDVNLRLVAGSLALLGPNGAGKSTLLGLLAGRLKPDRGTIRIFEHDPRSQGAARARAYIPQHLTFPPTLRAEEVLEAARKLKGATSKEKAEAVEHMALSAYLKRPVAQLSGGWRQRLALAAGLMGYSPLWLLDEPASALDNEGLDRLQDWLTTHLNTGGLVIMSAHRQEEISRLAEKFIRLEYGRVVELGSVNYVQEPS